jgi:cell division protein FtsB
MSIPARFKHIAISILFIFAAINFTRTTLSAIQSSKRLDDIQREVKDLEEEKALLQEDIEYRKTTHFIEKEARNKLNMILPGEVVYVLPIEPKSAVLSEQTDKNKGENKSNPGLWLELFL